LTVPLVNMGNGVREFTVFFAAILARGILQLISTRELIQDVVYLLAPFYTKHKGICDMQKTCRQFSLPLFFVLLGCRKDQSEAEVNVLVTAQKLVVVNKEGSNVDETYRPLLEAVGQLVEAKGFSPGAFDGTVTHIGNGYAVTAEHVVKKFLKEGASSGGCNGVFFKFGDRIGNENNSQLIECDEILYSKNLKRYELKFPDPKTGPDIVTRERIDEDDFAVIKLKNIPHAKIDLAKVPLREGMVTIF
jgi:hypothetical protein